MAQLDKLLDSKLRKLEDNIVYYLKPTTNAVENSHSSIIAPCTKIVKNSEHKTSLLQDVSNEESKLEVNQLKLFRISFN